MNLLVTGGAGFIGSNLIRHLLDTTEHQVLNLDLLTYAGNLENLADRADHPRYTFQRGDICDPQIVRELMEGIDVVLHLAAESHVDRSIERAAPFVRTNVEGTQVLLDAARDAGVRRFVHVSTDEVYGELPWSDPEIADPTAPRFHETTPLDPRSPYSASKASSDLLALACHRTHGFDVVVTRCSNNYGPYQFPEKLVPLMITNALENASLPVYGDGLNVRDWIHVTDHCRGILSAMEKGAAGEVYNFGGEAERTNLQVVHGILAAVGGDRDLITFVKDRPGHDRRYAIDSSKAMRDLGWAPTVTFEEGLAETVDWYRTQGSWWARVKSGEYQEYYRRHYEDRASAS